MRSVKLPRLLVAAVVLYLFALALFAGHAYSGAGAAALLALALGAAAACLVLVAGVIYANYDFYVAGGKPLHQHLNGTCK